MHKVFMDDEMLMGDKPENREFKRIHDALTGKVEMKAPDSVPKEAVNNLLLEELKQAYENVLHEKSLLHEVHTEALRTLDDVIYENRKLKEEVRAHKEKADVYKEMAEHDALTEERWQNTDAQIDRRPLEEQLDTPVLR